METRMKKFALLTAALALLPLAAHAQDASDRPEGSVPAAATEDSTATTLPAEQAPTNTTLIVPAARDAITNEIVPAEVPNAEEPESLRDKVRGKMDHPE